LQLLGVTSTVLLNFVLCFLLVRRHRQTRHTHADEKHEERHDQELDENAIFEKRQQILNVLSTNVETLFDGRLKVRHFMSRDVKSVSRTTPIKSVADLMNAQRIRHVFVCDDAHRLLGVVGYRNVHNTSRKAWQAMTPVSVTAEPDTPLPQAITLFLTHRLSCLPVVRDGRVCGVLTTTDLTMTLQCALHVLSKIAGRVKPLIEEHRAVRISDIQPRLPADPASSKA
jgi:CBS domain-containing protein